MCRGKARFARACKSRRERVGSAGSNPSKAGMQRPTKALGIDIPATLLGPRRRGDRIILPFAAVHESVAVKVFGCRPHEGGAAHTGAGVRKSPREETAGGDK
jgi:hypothetical protein